MSRACRQLELIALLPLFYGNGLATSLPWPPELLEDVIIINHLRSRLRETDQSEADRLVATLGLLKRIQSFSAEAWAAELSLLPIGGVIENTAETCNLPLQLAAPVSWQRVAGAFQSAAALYCMSSLLKPNVVNDPSLLLSTDSNKGDMNVACMRESYRISLLYDLRHIVADPSNQFRKLVLWPLVIAGIEVDPADEASKAFILHELAWISAKLGTASPLVGIEFLKGLWQSLGRNGKEICWDSLFDRPYVFAV